MVLKRCNKFKRHGSSMLYKQPQTLDSIAVMKLDRRKSVDATVRMKKWDLMSGRIELE